MEHKSEKSKESTPTSSESKGMLGSVWSAAGAILQNAVQGTIDAAYQTADRVQPVASKLAETATSAIESIQSEDTKQEIKKEPAEVFFSSPTNDMMQASKPAEPSIKDSPTSTVSDMKDKAFELADSAKKTFSEALSNVMPSTTIKAEQLLDDVNRIARDNIQHAIATTKDKESISNEVVPLPKLEEGNFKLELTMDVVAHLQRIADRTGDKILHETARKAHSACAKGVSDAPGVHLVRVTPEQATELVNLAILTQDHELADFARYCQSVAATTQIGIEPAPGKIKEELEKGKQELSKQGRMHTGPGYGAAFASVSRSLSSSSLVTPSSTQDQQPQQQQQQQQQPLQQIKQEESAIPAAAPAGGMLLTMDMVAHLQRIADRTGDKVLHETARKAHSACAKNLSDAPGVHLVSVTPDQASELVNLAIRTQDHELANFARYCQSVAATSQLGIEPAPGKIKEEIEKGRQELQQQGRSHTGPGYGAAFASISRSNSAQNLKTSRSSSPTNVPISPSPQLDQQLPTASPSSTPTPAALQLSMDVVAHLQRIADRTGDALLHETARKAHSACAKNIHEAPGVHLTYVTPEQATELVNLAIRTQDHELADFARYCQSVAATTQVAVEPSPGKIKEEIEKGRQELLQQGRSHTGPGYGAAFASKQAQPKTQQVQQQQQQQPEIKIEQNVEQVKPTVGLPSQ